jgi:uncharacterized protein (DUF1810 family)
MNPDLLCLDRFADAQEDCYEVALEELRRGRKKTHWIWFVFPQVKGLGSSWKAKKYAIRSAEEAKAYLAHPVLGTRLQECCAALLSHEHVPISDIMGSPDDLKLLSSMTLFTTIAPQPSVFQEVIDSFYEGVVCQPTIALLTPPDHG